MGFDLQEAFEFIASHDNYSVAVFLAVLSELPVVFAQYIIPKTKGDKRKFYLNYQDTYQVVKQTKAFSNRLHAGTLPYTLAGKSASALAEIDYPGNGPLFPYISHLLTWLAFVLAVLGIFLLKNRIDTFAVLSFAYSLASFLMVIIIKVTEFVSFIRRACKTRKYKQLRNHHADVNTITRELKLAKNAGRPVMVVNTAWPFSGSLLARKPKLAVPTFVVSPEFAAEYYKNVYESPIEDPTLIPLLIINDNTTVLPDELYSILNKFVDPKSERKVAFDKFFILEHPVKNRFDLYKITSQYWYLSLVTGDNRFITQQGAAPSSESIHHVTKDQEADHQL